MIDIETLDDAVTAGILSIAAVFFDIETGETFDEFYQKVKPESNDKYGLTAGDKTMDWWDRQKEEIRVEAFSGTLDLKDVLLKLTKFIKKHKKITIWSFSPSFDMVRLENAYQAVGLKYPWKFYQQADCRTLHILFPDVKNSISNSQLHNALADCHYQIRWTSAIYQKMMNGEVNDLDGETHINVYSKGKTMIGRWLSNFAHSPINLPDEGHFESVEGYWYWLKTNDDRLRNVYGYNAKKLGKEIETEQNISFVFDEEFKDKIRKAIDIKLKSNRKMLNLLISNDLELRHYYVYGGKRVAAGYEWILEHIEKRRMETKKYIESKGNKL